MEESTNHEKKEGHEGKKCHGFNCQCAGAGHKIVKLILAIIVVIALLSIGAAFGSRRGERFGNFNCQGGVNFREQGNWQNDGQNRGQFNMMRGNQIPNGVQDVNTPGLIPATGNPAAQTSTSAPVAPQQ